MYKQRGLRTAELYVPAAAVTLPLLVAAPPGNAGPQPSPMTAAAWSAGQQPHSRHTGRQPGGLHLPPALLVQQLLPVPVVPHILIRQQQLDLRSCIAQIGRLTVIRPCTSLQLRSCNCNELANNRPLVIQVILDMQLNNCRDCELGNEL